MQAEAFRKLYPEEFLEKFLNQGVRPDGRGLASAKTFSVHVGAVSNSPGSALVKVGETTVLTSIELSILDLEHESDTGRIEYELDVGPLGTTFENNNVAKRRQELASVCGRVKRTLSSVVDCSSLSLKKKKRKEEEEEGRGDGALDGKKEKFFGWCVKVKSLCVALDGCLFDASLASAVAALATLRLPSIEEIKGKEGMIEIRVVRQQQSKTIQHQQHQSSSEEGSKQVAFNSIPSCISLALYKDHILLDPTREEELLASAQVSITAAIKNHTENMEKEDKEEEEMKFISVEASSAGQRCLLTSEVMQKCFAIVRKRTRHRSRILKEAIAASNAKQ